MTSAGWARSVTTEWLDQMAAASTFLSHALLRRDAAASMINEMDTASLAGSWPLEGDAHRTGAVLLETAVREAASAEDLTEDFDALFIGPGRMHACPYESVYRSLEGLTFEAETMQVRRFYADHGLQAPAFNREPDDHIGLEVAFVGQLCLAAKKVHLSLLIKISRISGFSYKNCNLTINIFLSKVIEHNNYSIYVIELKLN